MQIERKMYLEIELYRADLGIKQKRLVRVDNDDYDQDGNPTVVSILTDQELLEAHLAEVRMEVA